MNVKAILAVAALALAAAASPAQAATHHKHKAKHARHAKSGPILRRAFAQATGASQIMHWRVQVDPAGHPPGLPTFTDDQWMHVTATGLVDTLHELRLDGPYQGIEIVTTQPNGMGDLTGAVTRDRQNASSPIRTTNGMGTDSSLAQIVSAALQTSHPDATEVTFEGHDAWQIVVRPAVPPHEGETARTRARSR